MDKVLSDKGYATGIKHIPIFHNIGFNTYSSPKAQCCRKAGKYDMRIIRYNSIK